jgi:hypothetical protein
VSAKVLVEKIDFIPFFDNFWKLILYFDQGDQIGRIFAYWAILFFGQFFLTTEEAQFFGKLFSLVKNIVLFLTKTAQATFWAMFFSNSTGHPD